VAALPLLFLINAFAATAEVDRVAGAVVGVIAAVAFIATCVMSSALSVIFRVALYRYATEGQAVAGFAQEDVAGAFGPPKKASA
jgi:hypothetical protein